MEDATSPWQPSSRVAACPACGRICRPRGESISAQQSVAQHIAALARQGCMSHDALWPRPRPPRRTVRTPTMAAGADGSLPELMRPVSHKGRVAPMGPPNVYETSINTNIACAVRRTFEKLKPERGNSSILILASKNYRCHVEKPSWGKSDIRWVSGRDRHTWAFFDEIFKELQVAELFSFLGQMVLFAGYFVVRRVVKKSHFHTDFQETGGAAFTFMMPLYDMSSLSDCHLLCETADGRQQYKYTFGRAIAFGDSFVHATETGEAPHELAFLSFTFGDKRMTSQHWDNAKFYISQQCLVYKDPAGLMCAAEGYSIC